MSGIYHWFAAIHWGKIADWAVAMGTLALAGATFWVARAAVKTLEQNKLLVEETHRLVEINKILIENEERHHQEAMSPFVLVDFDAGEDLNIIDVNNLLNIDSIHENKLYIYGHIENKGDGLAVNGALYFSWNCGGNSIKVKFPSLAKNETYCNDLLDGVQVVKLSFAKCSIQEILKDAVSQRAWSIILVVNDIFDNYRITRMQANQRDNSIDVSFLVTKDISSQDIRSLIGEVLW